VEEVRFTLEVVTPLFTAGADQSQAELRAPSFRGEMRYWLRAMLGGVFGTDTDGLKEVWKAEQSVFGTTERGSAVIVRLDTENLKTTPPFNSDEKPAGEAYLFWSMAPMGQPARLYYPPGGTFTLTLSQRGHDPASLKKAVVALWLLTYLGGIGSRSRRGAGSLAVTRVEGWDHTQLSFKTPSTPQDFQTFLRDELRKARKLITDAQQASAPLYPPRFDVLSPSKETSSIWVVYHAHPWTRYSEALDAIGTSMSRFRKDIPDHQEVARWFKGQATPATIERVSFGLPLPYHYPHTGENWTIQSTNGKHDRRASPVVLRVAKLAGAPQYVGVVVLFKAQFLSPDEQLVAENTSPGGQPMASPVPAPSSYDLIGQWIKKFPHHLEVTGW
jgi:CRISPR-associated protein Cmr1